MPTMMIRDGNSERKTRRRQVGNNSNRNALSSNNQIKLFILKGHRSNSRSAAASLVLPGLQI